jgi:membrane associated rhomboid family serine protease
MSHSYRRQASISFGGPLTPGIKYIILANLAMFTLQIVTRPAAPGLLDPIATWLGLHPPSVIPGLQIWRLVTWLFVHGGLWHILFNMLFLFMFGCQLERLWGTRFFLNYYFVCGVGAGLFTFLPFAYGGIHIGASGAIYAILLAYGMFFPRNVIYVMLTFPIEARYFVIVIGVIAFLSSLGAGSPGVSHAAHLGGLAVGYLYLRLAGAKRRGGRNLVDALREAHHRWRMKRLRKKFEQYYKERTGGSKYKYH